MRAGTFAWSSIAAKSIFLFPTTQSVQRHSLVSPCCMSSSNQDIANRSGNGTMFSKQTGVFLLDGGTGEELFRRGVPDDRKIWSATAIVRSEYHDVLREVHASFLQAGAQAITTNSYGLVPGVGFDHVDMEKYGAVAGQIARQVVAEQRRSTETDKPLVLGSLGPLIESYRADKVLPHNEGVSYYSSLAKALSPYVDAFLAETMSCVAEVKQAVDAVHDVTRQDTNPQLKPMLVSYTLDESGLLRDGNSAPEAVHQTIQMACDKVDLQAILFSCAQPEAITIALQSIQAKKAEDSAFRVAIENVRLGAYANRLTPVATDWTMSESDGPQPFRELSPEQYCADFCTLWVESLGATLVGGCCGMSPEYIAALREKFPAHPD